LPAAFVERDLDGFRKRFPKGVDDEQRVLAVFRGAEHGLPALRVTPAFAGLADEAVKFIGVNVRRPIPRLPRNGISRAG
jgi:hypothetical protein